MTYLSQSAILWGRRIAVLSKIKTTTVTIHIFCIIICSEVLLNIYNLDTGRMTGHPTKSFVSAYKYTGANLTVLSCLFIEAATKQTIERKLTVGK